MGLLDQILGGGAGVRDGTSKIDTVLLSLLALTKSGSTRQGGEPGATGLQASSGSGGGIAELLRTGIASMFGGGGGGVLSSGLSDLIGTFQQTGLGDIVHSWVSTGANKPISPQQLEQALGTERVNLLSQRAGVPREEVLATLSNKLPEAVDQLTPEGRLPNQEEAAR